MLIKVLGTVIDAANIIVTNVSELAFNGILRPPMFVKNGTELVLEAVTACQSLVPNLADNL